MIYYYLYDIFVAFILAGIGAALTSFMIALIYRLEKDMSYPEIATKGSSCEECNKELRWYELIPVISYIIFRGRCNRCGYRISLSYPIFELLLGVVFAYFYLSAQPVETYFIATALYFLALYDFYHQGFPKAVMHIFLLVAATYSLLMILIDFDIERVYSAATGFLLGIAIIMLNKVKESFGTGDVLVFIFLGFLLSRDAFVVTLILSIFLGAIGGLTLIVLGKASRKSKIPFVPFIWLGYILSFILAFHIKEFFATYLLLW